MGDGLAARCLHLLQPGAKSFFFTRRFRHKLQITDFLADGPPYLFAQHGFFAGYGGGKAPKGIEEMVMAVFRFLWLIAQGKSGENFAHFGIALL